MKKIILSFTILSLLAVTSCSVPDGIDSNLSALNSAGSANFDRIFDISTDNSGLVKVTPLGEGVSKSIVTLGHGDSGEITLYPGQSTTHSYPEGSYTVTIVSYDIAGQATTNTYPLEVTYVAPMNINATQSFAGTTLNLTATADYANGMLVTWGDGGANEVPTVMSGSLGSTFTAPAHTYAPGVYTLTVTALSGGAATTSATYPITVFAPYSLPITYESPIQNYSIGGTFGGVSVAVVPNPFPGGLNTSNTVWRYTKPSGAASWSGTWTPLSTPNGTPINIDNGNKIKVLVYSTEVGKKLNVEIEQGSNGVPNQILKVASTVANQWEELVFDFGPLGIPAGTTFNQLVFRYNDVADGSGEVIYIDNVRQTN
ncbi:hypothetical protein HKT18_11510 [Flavobacterium sp. IMCC34852]|uniref:PKD domain-containing protein n=1 Tax=Flavobacterium rivulicola TaxID=2732161 RepID=A0A7Y3VZK8_9FLAO|nr:hypothetical protein [Flavobacterium sp. IMCC34852]NNT72844.1 hypothetical protein [Flavobacterium sp. IMCC34852]